MDKNGQRVLNEIFARATFSADDRVVFEKNVGK